MKFLTKNVILNSRGVHDPCVFPKGQGRGYQVNVQGMGSSSKSGGEWSFEKWEVSQILPKSWSLAQPSNGSQSLILCLLVTYMLFYQVTKLFRLSLRF